MFARPSKGRLFQVDFDESFLDRIRVLMGLNRFGTPIEPIGYTPAEFVEIKSKRDPFILEVSDKVKIMFKAHKHEK